MDLDAAKIKIIEFAKEIGFDLVRVSSPQVSQRNYTVYKSWIDKGEHAEMEYLSNTAEKRLDTEAVLPGTKSVLCLVMNYFQDETRNKKPHEGWVSRYAIARDYHKVIRSRLKKISAFISAEFDAETRYYVDTGPVLERAFAEQSGIGYIGKNSCIITNRFGSWVFLAEILTTLALQPDQNLLKLRCGTCRRCVDACPTHAINENNTIDSRKCISYLTIENRNSIPVEYREKIGSWLFGCDICQEVCPHNSRQIPAKLDEFNQIRIGNRVLPLEKILTIETDEAFLETFAGTPLMRAKRRGLLRNACVVAGNSGQKDFIPLLYRIAEKEEDMLQEHALWAIDKLRGNG